jgi:hypothetical protein
VNGVYMCDKELPNRTKYGCQDMNTMFKYGPKGETPLDILNELPSNYFCVEHEAMSKYDKVFEYHAPQPQVGMEGTALSVTEAEDAAGQYSAEYSRAEAYVKDKLGLQAQAEGGHDALLAERDGGGGDPSVGSRAAGSPARSLVRGGARPPTGALG